MKAIFTKLERKRKRVSSNVMRRLFVPMGEAVDDAEMDAVNELMDMQDALLAGTLRPSDAVRRAKAIKASGAEDWDWVDVILSTAAMVDAWDRIERRHPKGLHLRGKRGQQLFITRSARGDAPSNRPWQLSHGDDVQRRDAPGKQFMMFGHNYQPSIRAAFIDAWDEFGPLKVIDIAESLKEATTWFTGTIGEARVLSREQFRELSQMRKDIVAGRRKASEVLAFIDSKWTPVEIKSDAMLSPMRRFVEGRAVWERERLDRVKRGIAVKTARGDVRYIARSARGDAPPGKPWQLTRGTTRGGMFEPHGHENFPSLKDAFLDAWDWDGPLEITDVSESFDYGLRFRPPAPGAVPKGFVKIGKHPRFKHGTVSYDRKLSPDEVRSYELEPLFGQTKKRSELLAAPRSTNLRELTAFAVGVSREFPELKSKLLDVVQTAKEDVKGGDDEKEASSYAHQAIAWVLEGLDVNESLDEAKRFTVTGMTQSELEIRKPVADPMHDGSVYFLLDAFDGRAVVARDKVHAELLAQAANDLSNHMDDLGYNAPLSAEEKRASKAASQGLATLSGKLRKWAVSESLEEAMPSTARTSFDSAPYSNMRLLDVARLLHGASQQARPNISLITKLVDRLVHALEFTIYSIQGRPEGKRVGTMIRQAFNNLTAKLPGLAVGERRDALNVTARLNEAVETLDLGPVEPRAR